MMLNEFIKYLISQVGQPYLWGGQHTKLTPDNYVRVIEKKEAGRGGYTDGTSYAQAVIYFCKRKFDAGASVLYAYDCSGLGVYWLLSVAHLWKADVNANTMMHRCSDLDTAGPPAKGWLVFRLDDSKKRAVHIGYMIDNEYLVEAKGRAYGVVKTKWREQDWDCWGIPKCFENEIRHPEPQPEPPTPTEQFVLVKGGSVWVRDADSTKGKKLFVAHKGQKFQLIDIAPSGWYHIMTTYPDAYITNKTRYTELKNG